MNILNFFVKSQVITNYSVDPKTLKWMYLKYEMVSGKINKSSRPREKYIMYYN